MDKDCNLIINIGCPRTATTTIQAYLLKRTNRHYVLTKTPFTSDNFLAKDGVASFSPNGIKSFTNNLSDLGVESTRNDVSGAIRLLCIASVSSDLKTRNIFQPLLQNLLEKILSTSTKKLLIHDERLCDCAASLMGNSRHGDDTMFAIYALISTLIRLQQTPLVVACLRDPIKYLRSKYIRTFYQRKGAKLKKIFPNEFIQKQSILEANHPGSSALAPAMHADFIKQLQKYSFVKTFGFKELLASDDVFSLMGLQGEGQYKICDFPRENKIPITKDQEITIEIEITRALKQYGYYSRINSSQMFE